jgi:osmotically-inducible protein OsmY
VNVEHGIVVLRGEVADDGMRGKLVSRAGAIPGVWSVHDLMHLPGETSPSRPRAAAG